MYFATPSKQAALKLQLKKVEAPASLLIQALCIIALHDASDFHLDTLALAVLTFGNSDSQHSFRDGIA